MNFITISNIGVNGRLANQLFQYAVLLVFSKIHKVKIKIPVIKTKNEYAQFRLDELFSNLKYEILSKKDKVLGRYDEQTSHYDEKVYNLGLILKDKGNLDLNGWFQSVKYFENYESLIRKTFVLKKSLIESSKKLINSYKKEGEILIGLHIRLRDYLDKFNKIIRINVGNNKFLELFKNYFEKKYSKCKFLLISDDINWCKKNLNKYDNLIYSENNDIIDFCLLTLCDNVVVSPSTFSWWASYLNTTAKEIFLPNKWMNPYSSSHIINNQYKLPYNKLKYELYLNDKKYKLYDPIGFKII